MASDTIVSRDVICVTSDIGTRRSKVETDYQIANKVS